MNIIRDLIFVAALIFGAGFIWMATVGIMTSVFIGIDPTKLFFIGSLISVWPICKFIKWMVNTFE